MASYGFSAQRPPSDAVAFKAQHIINTPQAVERVYGRVYGVYGLHGVYEVVITRDRGWGTARWQLEGVCSCPAVGPCSHLLAAGYVEYSGRKS